MYRLEIKLPLKNYHVLIKPSIIDNIGDELAKIYENKRIAIITDHNVERIYGEKLINNLEIKGYEANTISVEPGENSKSIETLSKLYDRLLDTNITRKDMIIAFGGGVIGDLGGFAAATLFRGIKYIQIPTSLLAQIDSSIGGKVAVNLSRGKNLVGNFYHPEAVFIDPELLKTLPKRYLSDGMAEVIKYACIKDIDLFNKLAGLETEFDLFSIIHEIIYTCCNIKKEIVEKDEKELGDRMLLNFGHTIGHAVEKAFNYERYTHGEAVAIGMYYITKRSEDIGITKKGTASLIKKLLVKFELPLELPEIGHNMLLEAINLDKKSEAEFLNIVLLKEIGDSFIKKIKKEDINSFFKI